MQPQSNLSASYTESMEVDNIKNQDKSAFDDLDPIILK